MGFKKTFCTCLGCLAGAACIILTGGTATPLVMATAIGIGGVAGHLTGTKIEKDEKKVKNKEKELAIRDKTIESLKQDNQNLHAKETEQNKKLDQLENQIQNRDQKITETRRKAQDPNLSEEDRKKWRNELTVLLAQQDDDKKERDGVVNAIKQIKEQISNNNKTISSVGSGSYGKDKGIWEFLTLENILIAFAIYALWQIIREDNRR